LKIFKKTYIFLYRILINVLATIYVLFDEVFSYVYDKLSLVISKIPNIEEITNYNIALLRSQHRYLILLFLITLIILSEYIGLISLMMFGTGHILYGVTLYIVKFAPFFLMSFVFRNAKDIILEIKWFNYCYLKFVSVIDYFKQTFIYIELIKIKELLKNRIKSLF
jgi:hypothetical protein